MENFYNSTGVSSPTRTEQCLSFPFRVYREISKGSSSSFFKTFALTLAIIFAGISGVWGQVLNTYNSGTGSWVCPAGVTSIVVRTWGAGGGGGSDNGAGNGGNGGAGGGGGAYSESILSVTPGTTYYYSVGTGGAATSTTALAGIGGDSWFNTANSAPTSTAGVLAKGGSRGVNNSTTAPANGGASASGFGTIKYSGGTGFQGSGTRGGGGGASAGTNVNGTAATSFTGAAAVLNGGKGGNSTTTAPSQSGSAPGGGGGGSDDVVGYTSGAGANGRIVISVASIPWSEGFETGYTDASSIVWSQSSVTGSQVWTANSSATNYNRTPRSGSFNSTLYYSNEDWLFYPVQLTGGTNYTFEVYARQDGATSTNSNITLAYGSSAAAASMTTITGPTGIVNGNYQSIIGTFTPVSTGVYYMGIKGYMNGTPYYISLDDISVTVTPSCAAQPSALTSSVTSTTAATLSWTAASPAPGSGYDIYYSTSATAPIAGTTATTTTAAGVVTKNITGLTANTTYYWWVRSNCNGTDKSNWVSGGAFTTLCNTASIPWTEDFESLSSVSTSIFPTCWQEGSGTTEWYSLNTTTTGYNDPRSGSKYVGVLYYNTTSYLGTSNARIWTPPFELTAGVNYDFSTFFVGDGYAGWTGDVIYNTSQSAAGESTLGASFITSGTTSTSGTNYTQILRTFEAPTTGTYYFGIKISSTTSPYGYLSFDDFSVTVAPACAAQPSALTSSVTSTTAATLSWTAASPAPGSGYDIYYSTSATAPIAGTTATTTTAAGVVTTNVTGLTANTTYYWWVRSNCNGTDKSNWVSGGTFFTGYCTPAPSSVDGTGITNVSFGSTPSVNNPTSTESGNYGNYSAQIGAGIQNQTLNVSVTYSTSYTYGTQIWVDWNNDLDFVDAGELVYTGLSTANNPTTLAASFLIPLAATAGNYRMRIGGTDTDTGPGTPCYTGTYGSFEDYTLQVIAPCTAPSTQASLITAGSISNTSASINWTNGNGAGRVVYINTSSTFTAPTNGSSPTANAVYVSGQQCVFNGTGSGPVTVSGLAASTTYWVRVYEYCSDGLTYQTAIATDNSTSFTTAASCVVTGNPATYGSDSWIGYVYNSASAGGFDSYQGFVTETETFNRTHTTIAAGASASHCSSNTYLFTIRYRMTKNFPAGYYTFTIGGDDGVRLSLDGGATWHINNWVDQGYITSSSSSAVYLSGNTNLVFEYYQNSGLSQSSFTYTYSANPIVPASGNNAYTLCSGTLYDHAGASANYVDNVSGYTVLYPGVAGNFIQLTGNANTESGYDFLSIYDGVGLSGTQLLNSSGSGSIGTITSTSGPLTVQFTSDVSTVGTGFALTVACVGPCSGTPAPGNTLTSSAIIGAGGTVNLSLSTPPTGLGLTYQWQSGPSNTGPWTNVGTSVATYSPTVSATTWYQCLVTCSGSTGTSTPVEVTITYCNPVYTYGTSDGDLISNVVITGTTLSNNTGTTEGLASYNFYTGQPNYTTNMVAANSYNVSVTAGSYTNQNFVAWIDYNDNLVFESSEKIGFSAAATSIGFETVNFTINLSCTPPLGAHRMRVRGVYNVAGSSIDPCTTYGYGETEDYIITIVAGSAFTPTFTATPTNPSCTNNQLTYTAQSGQTNYSWTLPGVSGVDYTLVSGGTSSSNTAVVTYLTSGSKTVNMNYASPLGCESSGAVTNSITVNATPTVTTANTASICSASATNISLTASLTSTYTWTVGTITGGITGASSGSGSTIAQTLTNPSTSASGTVQYIVTPTSTTSSCAGPAYTITVTVNPQPAVTTANAASICTGSETNISLTASATSTFAWTIGTITGSITGASDGSGSTIAQTLTNPSTSATGAVQYLVTPTATTGSCPGAAYTITVTVSPTSVGGTIAGSATVCTGTNSTVLTLSGHTGSITRWESSLDNFTTAGTTISNTTTTLTATNLTATTSYRAVLTSGSCSDANSSAAAVTVNQPSTTISVATGVSIANGDYLWSGNTSNVGSVASNWYVFNGTNYTVATSAPTTQNVYIVSNTAATNCVSANSNPPSNPAAGTFAASNVYIGSGTTLTQADGSTFNVSGNFINNGTFTPGTGTVNMNGSIAQTIGGTSATTFNNLTINNAAGVSLNRAVDVSGILTLTAGRLLLGSNNLTLGTSASIGGSPSSSNMIVAASTGELRKRFTSGLSNQPLFIFPVGTIAGGNEYSPVELDFSSGTFNSEAYVGVRVVDQRSSFMNASLSNYINRNWFVEPSGITSPLYDITLHYVQSDWIGIEGAETSVLPIKYSTSTGAGIWYQPEAGGFTNALPIGSGIGNSTQNFLNWQSVNSFSEFGGAEGNNQPLPVELVSFSGLCEEGIINLTWQTASEFNSSHFDVEKSRDGENWQVLTTLPSAGTSNELITYQSTDKNGTDGNNYFRLRQVDNDGKEKLYDPINVSCSEVTTGYFSSFPNPSGSAFQVIVNNKDLVGSCTLNIVDATGKVIEQREIEVKDGINMFVINQELTPGIYFLTISNGAKSTPVLRHAIK